MAKFKKADVTLGQADKLAIEHGGDPRLGYGYQIFTEYFYGGWTPYPWQEYFYLSPQRNKMALAGIRTGKSISVAAAMLHYMVYHPKCRLANACISSDQASVVFTACVQLAQGNRYERLVKDIVQHPYPQITLINGSELWCRSVGYEAELWRGWEFDWINFDEAAYCPREAVVKTLKGRLVGVGRAGLFTITTTPKGKGWLYEIWQQGDPRFPEVYDGQNYLSIRARTTDNTKLNPEVLADLFRGYSKRMIEQEMLGLFLDSEDAIFRDDDIKAAYDPYRLEVAALTQKLETYKLLHREDYPFGLSEILDYELDPEEGHRYICSWDLGKKPTKAGRNATVCTILDITRKPWKLVGFKYLPGEPVTLTMQRIETVHQKYRRNGTAIRQTTIDATGKGDTVNDVLEDEHHLDIDGIVYTEGNKLQMIHSAQIALERHEFVMPFVKRLVDELGAYTRDDDHIAQDSVMALVQALYRARELTGENEETSVKKALIATRRQMTQNDTERFAERRRANRSARGPGRTLHTRPRWAGGTTIGEMR